MYKVNQFKTDIAGLSHPSVIVLLPLIDFPGTPLADCYTTRRTPITAPYSQKLCRSRILRDTPFSNHWSYLHNAEHNAQEQHRRLNPTPVSPFRNSVLERRSHLNLPVNWLSTEAHTQVMSKSRAHE